MEIMHNLIFDENQCFKCDFCKFHKEGKYILCEKSKELMNNKINVNKLKFLENSKLKFINGKSNDLRLKNIMEIVKL